MGRLLLRSGAVGDYDGAYDWVRKEDYDNPDYTPGYHKSESGWPEDAYTIVETVEAAELEKLREVARAATALLEHPDVKPYAEHFIRIAGTEAQKSMRTFGALVGQLRDALAQVRGEERK